MWPVRRCSALRACLVLTISALAFTIPIYAGSTASYHQTGHIHIVNGTNAGISIMPTMLDFGNVTWGQTITNQITVLNNGDCVENVTATAGQNLQPTVMVFISSLAPAHSLMVNATYDTRVFNTPGDYSFSIDWMATCL